jgi:hypothetical protein
LESEILLLEQRVVETNEINKQNIDLIDSTKNRRQNLGLDRDLAYEQNELEIEYKIFEKDKEKTTTAKELELSKAIRNQSKKAVKIKKVMVRQDQFQQEYRHMAAELYSYIDCPVLLTELVNPCISSYGHVYEKVAIQATLDSGGKDPIARQDFVENVLRPHYVCTSIIEILNRYQQLIK